MIEEIVFWAKHFHYGNTTKMPEASDEPRISGIEAATRLLQLTRVKLSNANMRKFIEDWTDAEVAEERAFYQTKINNIESKLQQHEFTIELSIIAIVFGATGRIFRIGTPFDQLGFTSSSAFEPYRLLVPPVMVAIQAQLNDNVVLQEIKKGIEAIQRTSASEKKRLIGTFGSEILQEKNKAIDRVKEVGDEKIKEIENKGTKMLEDKKNELVENIILQDVMELWDGKARSHKCGFRIGALIFIAMIAGPILLGICYFGVVSTSVNSMLQNGDTLPLGTLFVFTIPALGYAWILRLFSKFTLQNMYLADDAAQRSVMAKTFVRLVAENKVEDDKDRAIMLNALFRPVPGAKEQDLQPPTIADFIAKQG